MMSHLHIAQRPVAEFDVKVAKIIEGNLPEHSVNESTPHVRVDKHSYGTTSNTVCSIGSDLERIWARLDIIEKALGLSKGDSGRDTNALKTGVLEDPPKGQGNRAESIKHQIVEAAQADNVQAAEERKELVEGETQRIESDEDRVDAIIERQQDTADETETEPAAEMQEEQETEVIGVGDPLVDGQEEQKSVTEVDFDGTADNKVRNLKIRDSEEGRDSYVLGGYHPVYIGEVYSRYEIVRKLGYGQYSTVWLVKDLTQQKGSEGEYRALKVLRADSYYEEHPIYEKEILTHLRNADPSVPGYGHICHLLDDFEIQGPNGKHVCLVFEVIGETLHSFRSWFKDGLIPNSVMRRFVTQLLMALDYAHDSGIIHTDIKPDNIFVKLRVVDLIPKFLEEHPVEVQNKAEAGVYVPLQSSSLRGYYFAEGDNPIKLDVCLGDWGVSTWSDRHLSELIQPLNLRAPEVLIGAPWDWTTDWWNLGTVILEVFRGARMFVCQQTRIGPYDLKTHLEEIVHFFGQFPETLLKQGDPNIVEEYFNDDGMIKDQEPMGDIDFLSDSYMGDLPQQTREEFVAFLYALMKLDPKERLPTADIIEEPWVRFETYEWS